jgi:4-hydroxybenzoyl-CoA thioesterase
MTRSSFVRPIVVRFKHCDPAGIAFYPKLLEFANDLVESWFAALGAPFAVLIGERGIGVPTVALNARFLRPCRYGEVLSGALDLRKLGDKSCALEVRLVGAGDELRAAFDITLVCVTRDAVESRAWPDDLAAAMRAWLADGAGPPDRSDV